MLQRWYLTVCVAVLDDYEDIGEYGENDDAVWSLPTSKDVDIDLKVVVPTGFVIAVDRLNPSLVLWQQKV